ADADPAACRDRVATDAADCVARCEADRQASQALCDGTDVACATGCEDARAGCPLLSAHLKSVAQDCKVALTDAVIACRRGPAPRACRAAAEFGFHGCIGPVIDSTTAAFVECDAAYDACAAGCD